MIQSPQLFDQNSEKENQYCKDSVQFLKSFIIYCKPTFIQKREILQGLWEPHHCDYFIQWTSPQNNLAYLQVIHAIQINVCFSLFFSFIDWIFFSKQTCCVLWAVAIFEMWTKIHRQNSALSPPKRSPGGHSKTSESISSGKNRKCVL